MERELVEVKGQLARSLSVHNEAEELRRGIERSERQRAQLSDHIEVCMAVRCATEYCKTLSLCDDFIFTYICEVIEM